MDPQQPPSFKRAWIKFSSPRQQALVILPVVAVLGFFILAIYLFSQGLQDRAQDALAAQGVSSEISRQFLKQTQFYYVILWIVTGAVGVAAFIWVWWISFWIFGPYRRLERDLNEVLYGRMNPENLTVRKGDALFPLIELFRKVIIRPKK